MKRCICALLTALFLIALSSGCGRSNTVETPENPSAHPGKLPKKKIN